MKRPAGKADAADKRKAKFVCEFCKAKLTTEARLMKHLCEQKRRWIHRDDKIEKLAFAVFHHVSVRQKWRALATQDSFRRNDLYLAFVRFARHLLNMEAILPLAFVDFLLRIEVKIDKWTSPEIYARYIRHLNKDETPLAALERNLLLMGEWAMATGQDWHDFFRCIAPAQAVNWIIGGRISPWLLFTASSALDLWQRLTPEQVELITRAVEDRYWQAKIARHQDEVDQIRATLAEHGI